MFGGVGDNAYICSVGRENGKGKGETLEYIAVVDQKNIYNIGIGMRLGVSGEKGTARLGLFPCPLACLASPYAHSPFFIMLSEIPSLELSPLVRDIPTHSPMMCDSRVL